MPRRRMGGAAFAFLFALVFARVSGATDERIVPDQDLSGLSREEQIAYLILNDQLADVRTYHRMLSEAMDLPVRDPMPVACIRVGLDPNTGKSADPSRLLLDLLARINATQDISIDVVPASACNEDGPLAITFREAESGRSAMLVETNAVSLDHAFSRGERCPGYQYWGAWIETLLCAGKCGDGSWFYKVGEDDDSIWLLKSTSCGHNYR